MRHSALQDRRGVATAQLDDASCVVVIGRLVERLDQHVQTLRIERDRNPSRDGGQLADCSRVDPDATRGDARGESAHPSKIVSRGLRFGDVADEVGDVLDDGGIDTFFLDHDEILYAAPAGEERSRVLQRPRAAPPFGGRGSYEPRALDLTCDRAIDRSFSIIMRSDGSLVGFANYSSSNAAHFWPVSDCCRSTARRTRAHCLGRRERSPWPRGQGAGRSNIKGVKAWMSSAVASASPAKKRRCAAVAVEEARLVPVVLRVPPAERGAAIAVRLGAVVLEVREPGIVSPNWIAALMLELLRIPVIVNASIGAS